MERMTINKNEYFKNCATCENYVCNIKISGENYEVDKQGICKVKLNTPTTYDTTCSNWKEVR